MTEIVLRYPAKEIVRRANNLLVMTASGVFFLIALLVKNGVIFYESDIHNRLRLIPEWTIVLLIAISIAGVCAGILQVNPYVRTVYISDSSVEERVFRFLIHEGSWDNLDRAERIIENSRGPSGWDKLDRVGIHLAFADNSIIFYDQALNFDMAKNYISDKCNHLSIPLFEKDGSWRVTREWSGPRRRLPGSVGELTIFNTRSISRL